MRKNPPQALSDVLKKVVEDLSQAKRKDIFTICSGWASVVGRELARHTRPAALKKGTLTVFVDDSAWFYQANLQKAEFLAALKKKVGKGKIQKILLRIGKVR